MNLQEGDVIQKISQLIRDVARADCQRNCTCITISDVASALSIEDRHLARVRSETAKRDLRHQYFASELFGEPGWNVLVDLFDSSLRGRTVSVTDSCIASLAPPTTALRWIGRLEELGLVKRQRSSSDGRVFHLSLTEEAEKQLRAYFSALVEG